MSEYIDFGRGVYEVFSDEAKVKFVKRINFKGKTNDDLKHFFYTSTFSLKLKFKTGKASITYFKPGCQFHKNRETGNIILFNGKGYIDLPDSFTIYGITNRHY